MLVKAIPRARFLSPFLLRGLTLGLIVLLGAVLRFRHLDRARGYYFQPDENVYTVEYVVIARLLAQVAHRGCCGIIIVSRVTIYTPASTRQDTFPVRPTPFRQNMWMHSFTGE